MDTKNLWDKVLSETELLISKANFNTWFKDTSILKQDNGIIYLSVPNTFVKEWLLTKYHTIILKSLRDISSNVHTIEYVITKGNTKKPTIEETPTKSTPNKELPLNDYYINKEDNLNPRYSFNNFVIGQFNELAYAASLAIIKKPGLVYNPLFIYGGTGRGKTHLIQSIGNQIKNTTNKKVFYCTSEKFALDYINAVQNNKVNQFKENYRKCDVLIMDDIQFFSNKEKTQEELFHLFNILYDNNKQIIFSSDIHPHYISNLEERLKSRFSAGMIVDIPAPDHESRSSILKIKSQVGEFPLGDDIISYLATNITGNIRDLEGALNAISCQSELKGRQLNLNEIKAFIKTNSGLKKSVSVKDIIKAVAEFYNIDEETIYEKTRRKEVIKPRQVTMYILRVDYNISYPSIGQKLGGRDHTTVIHSCEKIKNSLLTDNSLNQEILQIRSLLS